MHDPLPKRLHGSHTRSTKVKVHITAHRATKFKTTKFNSGDLIELFTKISTHENNPLYGILYVANLEERSVVINHISVACCNTCCNSPDSSTFVSVFRRVVTIEERSILLLPWSMGPDR